MIRLKRLSEKPILSPILERRWESVAVFNPGALYANGLFHLFYRGVNHRFNLTTEKPRKEDKRLIHRVCHQHRRCQLRPLR